MILTNTLAADPVAQFRSLVMADGALAQYLSQIEHPDRFVESAVQAAAASGIALDASTFRREIQADQLGMARWQTTPLPLTRWPPAPWLPMQIVTIGGELYVDWAYFGPAPLRQPFFEDSIRSALWRPFARMFLYRTCLADFLSHAALEPGLVPDGFIFHMSRCGSTLVSQMLAALPDNIAISEAAPIDAVVQLSHIWPALPGDQHAHYLRAMVAAFGRKRSGSEHRFFLKLDSWHALALPLFRRAFPDVPWIFLYRDPVEVKVSQARQPGSQMVPGILPPGIYGLDDPGLLPGDDYSARVLAKVCEAAAGHYGQDENKARGLLVNYRDLPGAFWSKILPHFGVRFSAVERDMMQRAARYDAKAQHAEFTDDRDGKQREASDSLRGIADTYVGPVYRRLEEMSTQEN